jgi:pSer/pThr/pTyr-binding forkhead associated (FHA) protein
VSIITQRTHAIEDPTAAIDVPPRGDDRRGLEGPPELARGRYLVYGDEAFALTADVTHLGRGITADVRLDDHTVSARHAIVVLRAERLRILDDRSTNGTFVNGRRVDEAELRDGDVVVLGRVVLTYRDLR